MAEFSVITLPESLESSQTITGVCFIQLGGMAFPDEQWNDFPVVILGWWLESLATLNEYGLATLRFMDGP